MSTHWQLIVNCDAKNFDAADAFDVGQRWRLLGSASMATSCVRDNFDRFPVIQPQVVVNRSLVNVRLHVTQSSLLEWWDTCRLRTSPFRSVSDSIASRVDSQNTDTASYTDVFSMLFGCKADGAFFSAIEHSSSYSSTMSANAARHLSGKLLVIAGQSKTFLDWKLLYMFLRLCAELNNRHNGCPVTESTMWVDSVPLHRQWT